MQIPRRHASSQRGAVLIHVAIALLGLIAFSTFVVDYGVMWVSRGEAQTAADAGALSGAIALAFENKTDFDNAKEKARAIAIANHVFGAAPDVQLGDVTFPPCPPNTPGLPDTCVKVDAFRNAARGNPLPVFFGSLVGLTNHGVRATATAQIVGANMTDCLKPWAVIDRWDEFAPINWPNPDPDFNGNSTFDTYSTGQGNSPPPEPDLYLPPGGANGHGTGFRLPADHGRRFAVKSDSNTNSTVSGGWFRAIKIPRLDGQNGGDVYRENIESCGGIPTGYASFDTVCPSSIGNDDMAYWAEKGCYATEPGNMVGPTKQGIEALIARDPTAEWVGNAIDKSAFTPPTRSPRVVPIGVIDINHFMAQNPNGANGVLKLVNVYGFFVEGMGEVNEAGEIEFPKAGGKAVIGRIMTTTGLGVSPLPTTATFLNQVILVR